MIGEKIILKKPMFYTRDSHYPAGMVDGAQIPQYFGDMIIELMMRAAGCRGRIRRYKTVDFTFPVYIGDVVEYQAWIESRDGCSFEVHFEAYVVQTMTDEFKLRHKFGITRPETKKDLGYEGPMLCDPPIHCGAAIAIVEVRPEEYRGPQDVAFSN